MLVYCLPCIGYAFTGFLYGFYFFKYCTDVLLIAPGILGLLYGLARIWDAIMDPLVGFLSDRSTNALGRRRGWLLVSAPAVLVAWVILWNPPEQLSGARLLVWLGFTLFW